MPKRVSCPMVVLPLTVLVFASTPVSAGDAESSPGQGDANQVRTPAMRASMDAPMESELVAAARAQIGVTTRYDPSYQRLDFPMGDVPIDRGVCTDVVIRALRSQGLDLQSAVNKDMQAHFGSYPRLWGLRRPDRNIDHRRVPNLQTYFKRHGWTAQGSLLAGDLVTWMLPGNLPHIGIVSDRRTVDGLRPLIIHNVGQGTREEDVLDSWPRTGHYRWPGLAQRQTPD